VDVYVVERYATGLTPDVLCAAAERMARAADGVIYVGSVFIPSDEGSLCLFLADSPAACREAAEEEGTPFERIVSAELVGLQT
jgi:Protein of unknown function (DUF4242)